MLSILVLASTVLTQAILWPQLWPTIGCLGYLAGRGVEGITRTVIMVYRVPKDTRIEEIDGRESA